MKRLVVTDESILAPAREYVRSCLEIMQQTLTPEKFDQVVQDVAQYPARINILKALEAKKNP